MNQTESESEAVRRPAYGGAQWEARQRLRRAFVEQYGVEVDTEIYKRALNAFEDGWNAAQMDAFNLTKTQRSTQSEETK